MNTKDIFYKTKYALVVNCNETDHNFELKNTILINYQNENV